MNGQAVEQTYDDMKERILPLLPMGFHHSAIREVPTAPEIDPQQVFLSTPLSNIIPIWKLALKTKTFYTSKPILVKLYQDEDLFFAENENLAVFGTGNTTQEALQDLYLHIHYFFEYYKKHNESKLIGDALRLKNLYKDLLIEKI